MALLAPAGASAQEIEQGARLFGNGEDTALLVTGASVANAVGLFPCIGGSIATAYEIPNRTWAVAGLVVGGTQLTLGGLSVAAGTSNPNQNWLTVYGAVTAGFGVYNLVVGLLNLVRRDFALHQLELLEQSWVMTPVTTPDGRGPALKARFSF